MVTKVIGMLIVYILVADMSAVVVFLPYLS